MAKIDNKGRETFLLRLNSKVLNKVKKIAAKEIRSVTAQIEKILDEY